MGERNGWVNVFHMFIRVCSLSLDDPSSTFGLLFQFQGPGITGLSCFTESLGHFLLRLHYRSSPRPAAFMKCFLNYLIFFLKRVSMNIGQVKEYLDDM